MQEKQAPQREIDARSDIVAYDKGARSALPRFHVRGRNGPKPRPRVELLPG